MTSPLRNPTPARPGAQSAGDFDRVLERSLGIDPPANSGSKSGGQLVAPQVLERRDHELIGDQLREQAAKVGASARHLVAGSLATAALGWVFWLLAARRFGEAAVGRSSSAVAAASLAALVATLGADVTALDLIPRTRAGTDRARLLGAIATTVALSSLLAAAILVVVMPAGVGIGRLFAAVVAVVTAVGMVLDGTMTAVGDSAWTLRRALAQAVSKLGLVAVLPAAALWGWGPLAAWSAALGAGTFWVGLMWFRQSALAPQLARPARAEMASVLRPAGNHLFANLVGQIPMLGIPLIMNVRLGSAAAGHAYVGWMVGGAAFMISSAVSRAANVSGAAEPERVRALSTFVLRRTLAVSTVVGVAVAIGTPIALGWFGAGFPKAVPMVWIMLLALWPDACTNVWAARWRVQGHRTHVSVLSGVMSATALGIAWWLAPTLGVTGAGVAWLSAQMLGCLYIAALEYHWRNRAV